jgi:putative glutamine amidotransferase
MSPRSEVAAARPLIGITSYREPASYGSWTDVPAVLVPAAYVDKVVAAGGDPLVIPPRQGITEQEAQRLLDRLDGLVLAGGVDVEPDRYGAERHPSVQLSRPDRDDTELVLARLARERDVPVLGICRGMQVMAVAAGGSLVQHLPDLLGHPEHAPAPATYGGHPVDVEPDSRLAQIVGERLDTVPTYHHQGVADAPGFTMTARADDGTPEAMEDRSRYFCVGVQWHPEVDTDLRIFEALVAAAGGRER